MPLADYETSLSHYRERVSDFTENPESSRLEFHFESLKDWSLFHTLSDVRDWFQARRENPGMEVEEIPLKDCGRWQVDPQTGNLCHESGEFFKIHGLRITTRKREAVGGWDQPILTQVGYDGGLLGILRQRHKGIPHYLIEAKAEPGNYEVLQLSPTLQATFSNLKRAHGGRKPLFAEYFENPEQHQGHIIFDQWLSEDGGRLHLKRNRGMMVEIPSELELEIPESFLWLSFYQIKALLQENAWVNPHIRGIIAPL